MEERSRDSVAEGFRVQVPAGPYIARDLMFDIPPGAILFVTGPNGSGKSTSLRAMVASCRGGGHLLAWLPRTPETVLHLPQNAAEMLHPLFRVRSFVGDFYRAHSLSHHAASAQMAAQLESLGIERPQMLLDQYPSELSGGQRQRLLFSLALLWPGTLMILDEPLSNLPPEMRTAGFELLRSLLHSQRSAVVVSHDHSVVRPEEGDRVLEI